MHPTPLFGFWNHFVSLATYSNGGKRPNMDYLRMQWRIVQDYKNKGNSVLGANASDFTCGYCHDLEREYRELGIPTAESLWRFK